MPGLFASGGAKNLGSAERSLSRIRPAHQRVGAPLCELRKRSGNGDIRRREVPFRSRIATRGNGYRTVVWNLKASDYGVPQARDRLFVVGTTAGTVGAPRRLCEKVTVGEAIADLQTTPLAAGRKESKAIPYAGPAKSTYAARLRGARKTVTGCEATRHSSELVARFRRLGPGEVDPETKHRRLDCERPSNDPYRRN